MRAEEPVTWGRDVQPTVAPDTAMDIINFLIEFSQISSQGKNTPWALNAWQSGDILDGLEPKCCFLVVILSYLTSSKNSCANLHGPVKL